MNNDQEKQIALPGVEPRGEKSLSGVEASNSGAQESRGFSLDESTDLLPPNSYLTGWRLYLSTTGQVIASSLPTLLT